MSPGQLAGLAQGQASRGYEVSSSETMKLCLCLPHATRDPHRLTPMVLTGRDWGLRKGRSQGDGKVGSSNTNLPSIQALPRMKKLSPEALAGGTEMESQSSMGGKEGANLILPELSPFCQCCLHTNIYIWLCFPSKMHVKEAGLGEWQPGTYSWCLVVASPWPQASSSARLRGLPSWKGTREPWRVCEVGRSQAHWSAGSLLIEDTVWGIHMCLPSPPTGSSEGSV